MTAVERASLAPHSLRRQTHAIAPRLFDECTYAQPHIRSCCCYDNIPHSARVKNAPSPNHRTQAGSRASVPTFPSIHPSAHAHSLYTDCTALVTKLSQQQNSKRASESIAQEMERTRARNGRTEPPGSDRPSPETSTLARSLARSLIRA